MVAVGVLHHHILSASSRIVCLSSCSRPPLSVSSGVAKVVLKKGKTQLFKDGSPMVYSGAVDRIIGKPPLQTGDVVIVADGTENPSGWGLYNSVSMFCVRLMQLQHESTRFLSLESTLFCLILILPSSSYWQRSFLCTQHWEASPN